MYCMFVPLLVSNCDDSVIHRDWDDVLRIWKDPFLGIFGSYNSTVLVLVLVLVP